SSGRSPPGTTTSSSSASTTWTSPRTCPRSSSTAAASTGSARPHTTRDHASAAPARPLRAHAPRRPEAEEDEHGQHRADGGGGERRVAVAGVQRNIDHRSERAPEELGGEHKRGGPRPISGGAPAACPGTGWVRADGQVSPRRLFA